MRRLAFVLLLAAATSLPAAEPSYQKIMSLFERVNALIEEGDIDAERDLAPVIAMLRDTKDGENLERVIDKLSDLGSADGSSPAAVKKYLVTNATPLLVQVAENRANKWSLRGSAIHALRDIAAPRAVLESVARMALADPDEFVKSRGEILENYIRSMPEGSEVDDIQPVDAEAEAQALEFLRSRGLGASLDQLHRSAIESKSDEVRALLAAGVDPNGGGASDSPLVTAITACGHQQGESGAIIDTVEALIAGGADVHRRDENNNTPLVSAGQYCGTGVTRALLEAGADPNIVNGSGITPLSIALIMSRFDAAEELVEHGAKLTKEQAVMVSGVTDPLGVELIKKATATAAAKKKKK